MFWDIVGGMFIVGFIMWAGGLLADGKRKRDEALRRWKRDEWTVERGE